MTRTYVLQVTPVMDRAGCIVMKASVAPVMLDGRLVGEVATGSFQATRTLGLMLLDVVEVGLVEGQPAIVRVCAECRQGRETPVAVPSSCPWCSAPLLETHTSTHCSNASCRERAYWRLRHFAGPSAMHIEGLAGDTLRHLMRQNGVRNPADLYRLRDDALAGVPGMQGPRLGALVRALQDSSRRPLGCLLYGLGAGDVEECKAMASRFGSLSSLMTAAEAGSDDSLPAWYHDAGNRKLMRGMLETGVDPADAADDAGMPCHQSLAGTTWVVTGVHDSSRDDIVRDIRSAGGRTAKAVTQDTSFVLAGADPGPVKMRRAAEFGIPVVDEIFLRRMLAAVSDAEQTV